MAKVRVFELAKELNMPSKDLVALLNDLGVKAKNHMSAIDENAARYVMRKYGPEARGAQPGKDQAQPAASGDRQAAGRAPSAQQPASTQARPAQAEPTVRQQARPQPPAPQQRPPQRPAAGHPAGAPQRHDDRARQSSISRPQAGQQGPRQAQPSQPLDPSYPFIPSRARPRSQGMPPRYGQPGQRSAQAPARPGGAAPGAVTPHAGGYPAGRPDRPVGGRPERGQFPPRPAGAQGAGPAQRQATRGPAAIPPKPSTATTAGSAPKGVAGRGKPGWTRDKRYGRGDDDLDGGRGERKASKRGRKKAPTSAPLGDAKLIERRVKVGDLDSVDDIEIRRTTRKRERQQKVRKVEIEASLTVRELANKLGLPVNEVMGKLIRLGVMASINSEIDGDVAQILATEMGFEAELRSEREEREVAIADVEDPPESLLPRPPVVTIMGHVDHGKTSLLDAIRQTNVTATEAGGITQHIGAYQVELNGRKITFLDTPGHEAFTAMRARGAQVTDVAVLVVAADDGVMPQTREAINHAKDAKVPIVVAINKIDKPTAQPDRVKRELSEQGLVPEEWGGDTVMVEVSAVQKMGINDLLEMILLVADMRDLKANPNRPAMGTVIEAKLDRGRGPVATVLINKGTLRIGDSFLVGEIFGRVRAMANYRGEPIEEATPSMPVEVLGLGAVPEAGDVFQVVTDEREAKLVAERRADRKRAAEMAETTRKMSLEDLFSQIKEGVKELRLIIKADVQGSAEALRQAVEQLSTDEVKVDVIHSGVGAVSESDVMLASASNAVVIGFNVRPDAAGAATAEIEGVDVRLYRVIYDVIDDVKKAMVGLLEPEFREVVTGHAEVRATFKVPKAGMVAGSYVTDGRIARTARVRVLRDGVVVHEGKLASLKRFKDDVREVAAGFECGIGIEGWNDVRVGDVIEAYGKEEVRRQL
ncbi:MAG: translation initiation factor IF-2 [Firmicutes bacterium]|nr:translation initiation factor IF-2 [Bacillota bacterium]